MYRYLGAHPGVVPSVRKETEYFSRRYPNGVLWYRSHFPLRRSGLTFEATPDYLFHPKAAERAARTVPDARVVVLLRDPVERAVSHWKHMTRLGFETLSFADAIEAEPGRIDADLAAVQAGEVIDENPLLRFSYRARGSYDEQVERWMAVYPRSRVLVLRSEDLFADPAGVLTQLEGFAGLAAWSPSSFRNWSAPTRDRPVDETDADDPAVRSARARRAASPLRAAQHAPGRAARCGALVAVIISAPRSGA